MKEVFFPLFNKTIALNPIAFTLFGIPVYWYAILIVASILLAFFLCKKKDGTFGISFDAIFDLFLLVIPIAFIGARMYYVLFDLENFHTIADIFQVKNGGLAIYGGIIGGVLAMYFFCRKRNIPILDLLDYVVPYLALGQSIGRWGNFINVEAYGTVTNLPWKMGIIQANTIEYVHPTFLYESIATFFIFIFLIKLSKHRKFSGEITIWYIILYSFIRFWIEGIRIDSLMFFGLRISQIVSFILFVVFCAILSKKNKKDKITKITNIKSIKKSHDSK